MNTDEKSKRVPIRYMDGTDQEEDRKLAAQVAKTQDFPYDHTCSYDKVRPCDCGHESEHLFDPKVKETESTKADAFNAFNELKAYNAEMKRENQEFKERFEKQTDDLKRELDEAKFSNNKHHLVEDAKKDVLACRNGINEIRKVLGEFEPATRDTWNDFMNKKINSTFPNPELAKAYHAYKDQVEQFIKDHPKFPSYIAKGVLLDEYPDQGLRKGDLVVEEQLPFGEMVFKRLTDKMFDTYKRKNADYGSSFDELFDEFGMDSVLIRLKDKYNRIKSLNKPGTKQQVVDESVEDTLLDMANYCILTLVKLAKDKEDKAREKVVKVKTLLEE